MNDNTLKIVFTNGTELKIADVGLCRTKDNALILTLMDKTEFTVNFDNVLYIEQAFELKGETENE
jgi:hypothetical protein